ncbi:LysR substrate-binding domain-containing protein [Neorhizobium galegae]|uniref:LysR substrate-binding domain-containing protein n=1 Tax=Neorhizobium galegae TaxID=399 RepID=UPI0006224A56|nr:LysR substrate-binding domain-containing protein [Neorhizobium galegae]CDZ29509.1 GcvA transcriptional dual regulator [Neorhizobium galegae bv. officinalis]KAA9386262.1 LysR family transcriptional regulator [Neorhizobium galegae]KAB1113294.1 LysR family transcriptional regulator [Neorhizobium galegae]MCM2496240.1 LysR substrate-binding domain-containing protein [Neorhizobium galegae]MCQ1770624.1 LysR substrate-binding domain-containing protein [Neorhizobium galegae]
MSNLNLVHLNGLRALEAVGRLGSLQAAADELGVSVGAVSQQVIKAEAQLGQPVFQRLPKGMMPVDSARPMLVRLSEGFHALSEAVAIGRRHDDALLTISVAPVFAARFLVHRLDRFSSLHPEIRLRIDATTRLADLGVDDIDLGIRVGPGTWPGVDAELLIEQTVFPVCSPTLAEKLKEPKDILKLPTIIDGPSMFSWEIWLNEAGLSGAGMATRHVFNDASLCLDATIAGQGVMLAWHTLATYALEQGRLVEPFSIRARTGMGHYLVTRAGARVPAKVRAFRDWLKTELPPLTESRS